MKCVLGEEIFFGKITFSIYKKFISKLVKKKAFLEKEIEILRLIIQIYILNPVQGSVFQKMVHTWQKSDIFLKNPEKNSPIINI